ncbi:hypothetical protein Bca52824_037301 [Brassica carinata]|uniref:Peptidase A1 domain-containing protein n=1 Tax=Brassica carinata TaxID=52824 RepID=A0A8X7S5I1_BRACI|nr:hypothetical protein Bca52824_037301 [Brassica carinata]
MVERNLGIREKVVCPLLSWRDLVHINFSDFCAQEKRTYQKVRVRHMVEKPIEDRYPKWEDNKVHTELDNMIQDILKDTMDVGPSTKRRTQNMSMVATHQKRYAVAHNIVATYRLVESEKKEDDGEAGRNKRNLDMVSFSSVLLKDNGAKRSRVTDKSGWLSDSRCSCSRRSIQSTSPYSSSRVAFLDRWFMKSWVNDLKNRTRRRLRCQICTSRLSMENTETVCDRKKCEGAQENQRRELDYHTIRLSSLFPSSSAPCVLSTRASNTKSSLHVTHRHGTCSRITSGSKATSPDHAEILRLDQARVNSIHSKLSKKLPELIRQITSTDLPANHGSTYGSGNYVVTVGIGTPKRDQTLIFDTGSDLTWIQCEPCLVSCYSQKEPIFNPSSSSSYHNVPCESAECSSLSSATGRPGTCSPRNCIYVIQYGDLSYSAGYLAKEKFTLTASNVFDGVNFGCGGNNQGFIRGAAGLLGLGRDELSFPSQTAATYNNIFSYCLPSSSRYTGHLTFGSAGISSSVQFTPISTIRNSTTFYGLDLIGISVGDQKLEIPPTVFSTPGALIDSGTVISRLPPRAYEALRSAFKARMSRYPIAAEI